MKQILGLFLALAVMVAGALPSFAETHSVVTVSLWDKGADAMADFDENTVLGVGTSSADMATATMGITADPATVPAGDVTFKVTNTSDGFEHEMVVAPLADASAPLPYDKSAARLDEDAMGAIGEVAETAPGDSGEVTLNLKPGTYILFCNIEGHYAMGMWTTFTVTE